MISIRVDERTVEELDAVAHGRDRSAVLRELIHSAYVEDRCAQAREDAERLRTDEEDRAELARVAEEMGGVDAW